MAYKVNRTALAFAKRRIKQGVAVEDIRDDWSEHAPTTDEENDFIEKHGMKEFAKWHLAIDPDEDRENKGAYAFPYGDFKKVHRCGVISAKSRAAQFDHDEVKDAADQLLQLIDKDKKD